MRNCFSGYAPTTADLSRAVKITFCIVAASVNIWVGEALLANGVATSAVAQTIAIQPAATIAKEPVQTTCRDISVEVDEGHGAKGRVIRWVCRKSR